MVSGRKALVDSIRKQTDTFGQAASPFSSFLVLRGVRTLPLRSAKGSENAPRLARLLEADPRVAWVRCPGLASHPDHALARRLLGDRFGAMLTFAPRGGTAGRVSLGDVFTLVYPRPKDGGIVRVSVGCEDVADLVEDFGRGLSFVG